MKLQIFRWGNGFFGASVGGMGLGGYAGVGWKGEAPFAFEVLSDQCQMRQVSN